MGLLQLTDFSGGYATDLDSEQMAPERVADGNQLSVAEQDREAEGDQSIRGRQF